MKLFRDAVTLLLDYIESYFGKTLINLKALRLTYRFAVIDEA